MQSDLEIVLPLVEKPARYIGGETGAAPSPGPGDLRVVLCFPDVYEIGMSHRGLLNLYAVLAAAEGVAPERCFAPWPDMAAELQTRGIPLASLESGQPIAHADVLGFSFASPLNFTTALMMLDIAGVPLLARDRADDAPLVIGGGQAMFNPEPMAPFLDAVAPGEGEEVVVEIAEVVRSARAEGLSRADTLKRLGALDGVYVPSWYEPSYEGGRFAGLGREPFAPRRRLLWAAVHAPSPPLCAGGPHNRGDRRYTDGLRTLWPAGATRARRAFRDLERGGGAAGLAPDPDR